MTVYEHLLQFSRHNCESNYRKIRNDFNRLRFSDSQAARFIYLNKTSFNGIFRVNRQGKYNVPYGHILKPSLPTRETLLAASATLRESRILTGSYETVLNEAQKGNFIYMDPPYPPLSVTSNFNHYTKDKFVHEDQIRLSQVAFELDKKGCFVMISNAHTDEIMGLFKDWHIAILSVVRWITCKPKRHRVEEIVIRNY